MTPSPKSMATHWDRVHGDRVPLVPQVVLVPLVPQVVLAVVAVVAVVVVRVALLLGLLVALCLLLALCPSVLLALCLVRWLVSHCVRQIQGSPALLQPWLASAVFFFITSPTSGNSSLSSGSRSL